MPRTTWPQAIQINFAEQDVTCVRGHGEGFSHKYKIEGARASEGPWVTLIDKTANTQDVPHDYVPLEKVAKVRFVRITNAGPMPGAGKFAVRDMRIFGDGLCGAPEPVTSFEVLRDATHPQSAELSWQPVANAEGYVIRYGIGPDKLYNHSQVLGGDSAKRGIRLLMAKGPYYFTIDSYGSGGIQKGTGIKDEANQPALRPASK